MQLSYNINLQKAKISVTHADDLFLIGSCFSENIGSLFKGLKFKTYLNPYGITFNPLSISETILQILEGKVYEQYEVFEENGRWLSWKHHSKIYSDDKDLFVSRLNEINKQAYEKLISANFLIVTLGSSYYYELNESKTIVNNCHKQPANLFTKKLAEAPLIVEKFGEWIDKLKLINPNIKILLTISPVRHLKEGVFENNISKSNLFIVIYKLQQLYSDLCYFPAYEIVMDELRDYRFFERDFVHPNQLAIEYIWEKFADVYFDSNTKTLNNRIASINNAAKHKIFNFKSPNTLNFLKSQYKMIEDLEMEHSFLKFDVEKNYFCNLIEKFS